MTKAARISRDSKVAITPFDRHCWGYSRSGMDPTAIATIMNATPEEVTAAVTAMEKWKAVNSMDIVVASMNEQALIAMEPVGITLAEAQAATRLISPAVVNPKTGEVVREAEYAPDYTTRIAATEAVARIVESVREKGPGVQVNVGGNQLHMNGNGGGRSFEERLRLQREARGMRQADMEVTANGAGTAAGGTVIDGNAAEIMQDGSNVDEDEYEDDDDLEDDSDDELEDEEEDAEDDEE